MRPIKNFDEFISEGIIKKQTPDISRAKFLLKETEKSYLFVSRLIKNIGINDENANSIIKLCYDVIMELIRANMLMNGFNASGQGAHEAEVAYLKEIGFTENDVQFTNQLRYFRNGMLYYGTILDKDYAEKILEFINKIYPKLKKLVDENAKFSGEK